jgi:hypothetical protein
MAKKKSAEEDDITAMQMANLLTVLDRHQIQAMQFIANISHYLYLHISENRNQPPVLTDSIAIRNVFARIQPIFHF